MGDVHIKRSGSWSAIEKCHVKHGGSWQEVQKIHIKRGGSWDEIWQNVVLRASNLGTSLDSDTSGSTITVGFRFNRDGTIDMLSNGTWQDSVGDWITPTSSTVGDDYEIMASEAGNSSNINVSAADGSTYYSLGSTVTFSHSGTVSPAPQSETLTFNIRKQTDTSFNTSFDGTLETELFI